MFDTRHPVLAAIVCTLSLPLAQPATAGDIYGNILLRNYDTDEERPITRQVPITVQTTKQRIEGMSRKGATYYMSVPEEGRFQLTIEYRGRELSTEIGSYYNPNRYDLVILYRGDRYALWVEQVEEHHKRPQDKDW